MIILLAGTSGKELAFDGSPLTSVQVAPPSVVRQTCPYPAPGPSFQCREKPDSVAYALAPVGSDGSMVTSAM